MMANAWFRFRPQRLLNKRLFQVLKDPMIHDTKLPQFMVGLKNGFLPRSDPLAVLPSKFQEVDSLLDRMPILRKDGKPGLLASGEFGNAVLKELPVIDVSDVEDSRLLYALFRDYTFLASAYLLEPCDLSYRKSKTYGLGRDVLPKNIAIPLCAIADKMGSKPFMEYALSYALYNYERINPSGPLVYDNIKLIRTFEGGHSEKGFVAVHVTMVSYTPRLVQHVVEVLDAADNQDRKAFDASLKNLNSVLKDINTEMETMWSRSYHQDYDNFRTFIMGIKNQPMFPKGVIYEGVSSEPRYYRGESGANDSIVPTIDNLLELTERMPQNPLTDILKDFRTYRPSNHNEFLQWVESRAKKSGVRKFAVSNAHSAVLYLATLDQVRDFRHRHWNFTKEYILRYSNHPVATGGSPIVTWLPNQLSVVMKAITDVGKEVDRAQLSLEMRELYDTLVARSDAQIKVLAREVDALKKKYPNQ